MAERIRIILADDHAVVLQGLRTLLQAEPDLEVVAAAHDGDEALERLEACDADVLVVDLEMPFHGFRVLEEIRRRELPIRVVVLTAFGDVDRIQTALELGAEGFAMKTESPRQVMEAIRQVARGRMIFPHAAQRWIAGRSEPENPKRAATDSAGRLSSRQWEVLAHVARGRTNQEIGRDLGVSVNTIRFHLKNIFNTLNVSNRTEAAGWYFEHGDIKPN